MKFAELIYILYSYNGLLCKLFNPQKLTTVVTLQNYPSLEVCYGSIFD